MKTKLAKLIKCNEKWTLIKNPDVWNKSLWTTVGYFGTKSDYVVILTQTKVFSIRSDADRPEKFRLQLTTQLLYQLALFHEIQYKLGV